MHPNHFAKSIYLTCSVPKSCLVEFNSRAEKETFLSYPQHNKKNRIYSVSAPSVFNDPPVTNNMLLYSKLLCKKIARAPGGSE